MCIVFPLLPSPFSPLPHPSVSGICYRIRQCALRALGSPVSFRRTGPVRPSPCLVSPSLTLSAALSHKCTILISRRLTGIARVTLNYLFAQSQLKAACISLGIALGGSCKRSGCVGVAQCIHKDKVQAAQLKQLCSHYGILPAPRGNPARVQALKAHIVPPGD